MKVTKNFSYKKGTTLPIEFRYSKSTTKITYLKGIMHYVFLNKNNILHLR